MKTLVKKTLILLLVSASVVMFGACEKVIELDLNNSQPVLVIEGGVSNQLGYHQVKISKTISFDKKNDFNPHRGASVSLTSDDKTLRYIEISPGIYRSPAFRGIPGVEYTLNVTTEGKSYTASSVMPGPVALDSIDLKRFSFLGDTNTYVAVSYDDPPGVQNQYRHIIRIKGKVEHETVTEDRFNNGNPVSDVIFYELDDLKKGDRIEVEMQCIDRPVFRYFFALSQISGDGGPPVAPSNPVSNFNNGALGVFSAYTTNRKAVVLK